MYEKSITSYTKNVYWIERLLQIDNMFPFSCLNCNPWAPVHKTDDATPCKCTATLLVPIPFVFSLLLVFLPLEVGPLQSSYGSGAVLVTHSTLGSDAPSATCCPTNPRR